MEPSGVLSKKIVRMRTFKDDAARVLGETATTVSTKKDDGAVVTPVKTTSTAILFKPVAPPQKTIAPLPKQELEKLVTKIGVQKKLQTQGGDLGTTSTLPQATVGVGTRSAATLKAKIAAEDVAKIASLSRASILSDRDEQQGARSLSEGTIVRDKVRKRFRLFPAIVAAVTGWFESTKTEYQKTQAGPVHTVEAAKHRLETIRKAIDTERLAPKDDYKRVSQVLAQTERPDIETGVVLNDKSTISAPSWTHVVDTDEPVSVEQTVPALDILQNSQEAVPLRRPSQEVAAVVPPSIVDEAAPPQYTPEFATAQPEEPKTTPLPPRRYAPAVPTTSGDGRFYIVFAVVIFLATLLGVGVSYYIFGRSSDTGVIVKEDGRDFSAPSLFKSSDVLQVPFTNDRETFLLSLTESTLDQSDASALQLVPVFQSDGGVLPADTASILEVLALRTDGSFARSAREISFGSARGEPFIVMSMATFDTAFGGLLAWEQAMSADLSPLFGTPIYESFNPEARTSTQTTAPYFRDIVTANKNARVLVDENNNDRIIYTFVDQNTILITTTREMVAEILPLIN